MPTFNKPSLFDQLGKADSDEVKDAITRRCRICDTPAGEYCKTITNGTPLEGRLVHLDRTYP